jgi:hypothetical protein
MTQSSTESKLINGGWVINMSKGKLFSLVLCLSICASPAYAYIDPGAGSIILQGLIGGIAAGIAFLSVYFRKIKEKIIKFVFKSQKVIEKTEQ